MKICAKDTPERFAFRFVKRFYNGPECNMVVNWKRYTLWNLGWIYVWKGIWIILFHTNATIGMVFVVYSVFFFFCFLLLRNSIRNGIQHANPVKSCDSEYNTGDTGVGLYFHLTNSLFQDGSPILFYIMKGKGDFHGSQQQIPPMKTPILLTKSSDWVRLADYTAWLFFDREWSLGSPAVNTLPPSFKCLVLLSKICYITKE